LFLQENLLIQLQDLIGTSLVNYEHRLIRAVAVGDRSAKGGLSTFTKNLWQRDHFLLSFCFRRWEEEGNVDSSVSQTLKLIHADTSPFLLAKSHLSSAAKWKDGKSWFDFFCDWCYAWTMTLL